MQVIFHNYGQELESLKVGDLSTSAHASKDVLTGLLRKASRLATDCAEHAPRGWPGAFQLSYCET